MTEWKDIEGFEGLYQVSNYGDVRSLDRYVNGPHGDRLMKGRILKPISDGRGRIQIVLSKESIGYRFKIHRLVATYFLENTLNLPEVNHIDGDPLNNKLENLEWVDRKSNVTHAVNNNLYPQGERHYKSRITDKDVLEIRKIYSEGGITQESLAKTFNVSRGLIKDVVNHKSWKHVGGERTVNVIGGENDVSSKLSDKEVLEIKDLNQKKTFTQKDIANYYGVSQSQINRIVNGKRRVK